MVEERRHRPEVEGTANSTPWTCVEVEAEEVVVGSALRCLHIDGVMTWKTGPAGGGSCPGGGVGTCVPDELAQNLDFVLVLGGEGVVMNRDHRTTHAGMIEELEHQVHVPDTPVPRA